MQCIFSTPVGSADQLRRTELANGIVQDEPEIIVRFTDLLDLLLHKIRTATAPLAGAYGACLARLIGDFIPPSEILTKVVKELLTASHPCPPVIGRIAGQVFRAMIDAAYLALLQDWLICSLQSFLVLEPPRAVWSLTVVFVGASLDVRLQRLFEVAVAMGATPERSRAIGSPTMTTPTKKRGTRRGWRTTSGVADEPAAEKATEAEEKVETAEAAAAATMMDAAQLRMLRMATEDFYKRLTAEQRKKFRAALAGSCLEFMRDWLKGA